MNADDVALAEKVDIEKIIKLAVARAADGRAETEGGAEVEGEDDGGVVAFEKLKPLPLPGSPYTAYARPSARALLSLSLLKADGTVWSYPYSCRVEGPHLVPAGDAANNLVVLVKFAGLVGIEVTLSGRRLEQMVNYLSYHRIAWVREQPKGKLIQDADAPVVTGIAIKELER